MSCHGYGMFLQRHVFCTGVEFDLQVPPNWIKNGWSIYTLIRSVRHTFKRKKYFSTHLKIYHIMPKQLIATKLLSLSKIKHWRMTCMYNTKNTITDKQNNLKGEFTNSWPVVVWMFPKQGSTQQVLKNSSSGSYFVGPSSDLGPLTLSNILFFMHL